MGFAHTTDRIVYEEFSSLHEMAYTLRTRKENSTFAGRTLSSEEGDAYFTRTATYEEAEKLMLAGWDEPLAKIQQGISQSEKDFAEFHAKRVMPINSIVGVVPNVPRVLFGLPDSMIQYKREREAAKTVRLIVNITASGSVDQEDLVKYGTAVLSLTNLIEKMGVRVRLDLIEASSADNQYAAWGVTLKDYREPMDLKKMCFPIAHPSMLRRIAFRWIEVADGVKSGFYGGYGYPVYDAPKQEGLMDVVVKKGTEDWKYFDYKSAEGLKFDIATLYRKIMGKELKKSD